MKLDLGLLVKLKYESNTVILFVGIRYSMRDLPTLLTSIIMPELWKRESLFSQRHAASVDPATNHLF